MVFGTCTTRRRGEGRVVAADREQLVDAEAEQRIDGRLEEPWILRGVGAGDPEDRAAAEMDAADVVDVEWDDLRSVALHDVFEAVPDAEDLDPRETGADGGRTDDAVDAGGGAAADENGQFSFAHVLSRWSRSGALSRGPVRSQPWAAFRGTARSVFRA
jgi:hypothetical protein